MGMMRRTLTGTAAAMVAAVALVGLPALADDDKLKVEDSDDYGRYLTDADGRALYLFTADTQGQVGQPAASACYDTCADAWPPLVADDTPEVGDRLAEELVETVDRRDGEQQVSYAGWPLYYFVRDSDSGDVTGQGVESFGGVWHLVSPEGEPIDD